ncbi:uncharacterized protein G2W53_042869 [Senna tora]|uniref:Uncharacterized protein n=1 Tax=Senna tora TaxID=362788 RepID=A0A834SJT8_9FABA|nr:uncharacterized protein G2W53_042869 [Senna tora]
MGRNQWPITPKPNEAHDPMEQTN